MTRLLNFLPYLIFALTAAAVFAMAVWAKSSPAFQ